MHCRSRSLLIAIIGLVQIVISAIVQIFSYQRIRRILNLLLLGTTAIVIVFAGDTLSSFISITNNLKVAKADIFDYLYALRQIRSISDKVNADESRYLLDRSHTIVHEQSFNGKINKILTIPAN